MPVETAKRVGNIDTLTSFRFIAAIMVFVWHTHMFRGLLDPLQLGYVGVGFFYLLSGFILTYVYCSKLAKLKYHSLKRFYIARIAKIYPVHLLTFFIALPLSIGTYQSLFIDHTKWHVAGLAFTNLTLTQSYYHSAIINFSFNGVAWSISDELFFYALFPLIIAVIAQKLIRQSTKKLLIAGAGLWLLFVGALFTQTAHIDDWFFYIFPLMRLPEFLGGVLLGVIYLKNPNLTFLNKSKSRATLIEVSSLLLLIAAVLISVALPQSVRFGAWLMPFWAAIIIVYAAQQGRISSLLKKKVFIFLGEISFSFYMFHLIVLNYVALLHLPHLIDYSISLILAVIVSSISYLYFEEPVRVRLKAALEYGIRKSFRRLLGRVQVESVAE